MELFIDYILPIVTIVGVMGAALLAFDNWLETRREMKKLLFVNRVMVPHMYKRCRMLTNDTVRDMNNYIYEMSEKQLGEQ